MWKEIFSDIFLAPWLTQFGQVTTCAFIITIQSKQRLEVNSRKPFVYLKKLYLMLNVILV